MNSRFFIEKQNFFTPIKEAVTIAKKRRKNIILKNKVDTFLGGNVPKHFEQSSPILYLSRHIATANFEALHFIELAKPFNLPIVIGQDTGGKFVSINPIKKCLGKMSVVSGMTRYEDEIIEKFTIIDFNSSEGKVFKNIVTKKGKPLVEFHNELLREVYPYLVEIGDEESWVDKNFRDNILQQYEKILTLNTYYGIIFESFPTTEIDFFNDIFAVAFNRVTHALGEKPLVVELLTDREDSEKDWNAYPSIVYPFIKL